MSDYPTGLFIFQNDLRVADNLALDDAARRCKTLICCFCFNPSQQSYGRYGMPTIGKHRLAFLQQSLDDLEAELKQRGQRLVVLKGLFDRCLTELISLYQVDAIFLSKHQGYYENTQVAVLERRFPYLPFHHLDNSSLFAEDDLPVACADLPETFSKFRKLVEPLAESFSVQSVPTLPPPPQVVQALFEQSAKLDPSKVENARFHGGENAGRAHLQRYFSGAMASTYKQTRNALDDFPASTKFSPWLALGCLSPRQIMSALREYEGRFGANDSTYWIGFELLWREFFFWHARKHGQRLFAFSGVQRKSPATSFYPERFKKWCAGNTPYAIVNACMKQLNETGYMSNRGRQLVASCLVHELSLDWRYGAAYFEQQLIDYDVSSNWGNWQYLAGVGTDPRGHRRFDLAKQTAQYDPDHQFIEHWQGVASMAPIDTMDAADWPIVPLK